MQYLILIRHDDAKMAALSSDEQEAIGKACDTAITFAKRVPIGTSGAVEIRPVQQP
jgi:hypothetical protein